MQGFIHKCRDLNLGPYACAPGFNNGVISPFPYVLKFFFLDVTSVYFWTVLLDRIEYQILRYIYNILKIYNIYLY